MARNSRQKWRRQTLITVQPYDELPYWDEAGVWEPIDADVHLGCVSLDPFGTNRMSLEWAAYEEEDGEDEHSEGKRS